MSQPLAQQQCTPQASCLPPQQLADELLALPGWQLQAAPGQPQAIEKTWRFGNFHETMAFVNAVAYIAHQQDHHPDLALGYAHCTVRWSTHSAGGVTINDLICAARIEALGA